MANQQQQQNVNFKNVLMMHNRLKRLTNLPLFYTDKSKDTTTSCQLIEGVKIAAGIATWDD